MFAKLIVATALLATPAFAQDKPQDPPKRVRSILLYDKDECPKPTDPDEIVVCANVGESPYRIPKPLREHKIDEAGNQPWANRMETVEDVSRTAAGMPNSCSTVGTGGQTGCTRKMLQQWYQERLDARARAARIPGNGD